jgi:hypothetical protein
MNHFTRRLARALSPARRRRRSRPICLHCFGFSGRHVPLIYLNGPFGHARTIEAVDPPDERKPDQEAPEPQPPRSEEILRIIEDYANGLREIIKKLRRRS